MLKVIKLPCAWYLRFESHSLNDILLLYSPTVIMSFVCRPSRFNELVSVHGRLDPLVSIDMKPSTLVKVKISHNDFLREEVIKVYQTVQQFKALLHQWFKVPPQNQKLFYCDKVIATVPHVEITFIYVNVFA